MKQCGNSRCKKQPISEFNKDKSKPDGLQRICKSCRRARYNKDKERILAKRAIYYQENKDGKIAIYYQENKERLLDNRHKRYYENIEKESARASIYYQKNKEELQAYSLSYYHSHLEEKRIYHSKYKKDNPGKITFLNRKRHTLKLKAMPSWLSESQSQQIEDIYIEAARRTKETGISHHVDHILPLQNKDICGLHIPLNLQILTELENIQKHNKFDFTYANIGWKSKIVVNELDNLGIK
jgi:hypothetical protein